MGGQHPHPFGSLRAGSNLPPSMGKGLEMPPFLYPVVLQQPTWETCLIKGIYRVTADAFAFLRRLLQQEPYVVYKLLRIHR